MLREIIKPTLTLLRTLKTLHGVQNETKRFDIKQPNYSK